MVLLLVVLLLLVLVVAALVAPLLRLRRAGHEQVVGLEVAMDNAEAVAVGKPCVALQHVHFLFSCVFLVSTGWWWRRWYPVVLATGE